MRQGLARPADGRRGGLRQRGAAPPLGVVGRLAPCRRRGQRQWNAGPRWRHGGQRDRGVETGATAVWGLWRAVQLRCQETVLVLRTSELWRAEHHRSTLLKSELYTNPLVYLSVPVLINKLNT